VVGYGGEAGLLGKESEGEENGEGMKKEENDEGGRVKGEKEKGMMMMMLTEAFFFLRSDELSEPQSFHLCCLVLHVYDYICRTEKKCHARVQ